MSKAKIKTAVMAVLGAIVIMYVITGTFNDLGGQANNANTSYTGGTLIRTLFPLLLAVGAIVILAATYLKSR